MRLTSTILFILPVIAFAQLKYPKTQQGSWSDVIFKREYKDSYRWLENMESDSVVRWFKTQAAFTDSVVGNINGADELLKEWERVEDSKQNQYFSTVECNGKLFHFLKKQADENGKVYLSEKGPSNEEVLFDPRTYAGGRYRLSGMKPSPDGRNVLLELAEKGSEIKFLRIISAKDKQLLSDSIFPCSGGEWSIDGKNLIYVRVNSNDPKDPELFKNLKVFMHRIGTITDQDRVIFGKDAYPELNLQSDNFVGCHFSPNEPNYIYAWAGNDDGYHVYFVARVSELDNARPAWKKLSSKDDKLVKKTAFVGGRAYSICGKNTPNFRLVSTALDHISWKTVVDQKDGLVLESYEVLRDFLILKYTDGINSRLFRYDPKSGETTDIRLPQRGSAYMWSASPLSNDCYINLTSWNLPKVQYRLQAQSSEFVISEYHQKVDYPASYSDIVCDEVEARSYDGTMVPLSIIYRKGTNRNGKNICMVEGYGAYGWSITSFFNPQWISVVSRGVVIAIAHVRGGGEKGEQWEKAGYKTTKPNTWKDFISCSEYLIEKGYTSRAYLVGSGVSAGGVMIGRAITERPDLFRVAICNVPVLNTMRLHKMPNGPNLAYQFGSITDSLECLALAEMDAVRHVKTDIDYPAVICVTGWQDPRVSPWQSAKFIAALQASRVSKRPTLLKVNYETGHFADLKTQAEFWALALNQCGHPSFKIK
jgi:prolyl oligopeptidase